MPDATRETLVERLQEAEKAYSAALTAQTYAVSHGGGDLSLSRQNLQVLKGAITLARRDLIDYDANAAGGRQGIRRPVWS